MTWDWVREQEWEPPECLDDAVCGHLLVLPSTYRGQPVSVDLGAITGVVPHGTHPERWTVVLLGDGRTVHVGAPCKQVQAVLDEVLGGDE